jgi:hypothetical protein
MFKFSAFIEILKFTWLAFLPLLFTSYVSPGSFTNAPDPGPGNYHLMTTEGSNLQLNGNIFFDTSIKESSVIHLRLQNHQEEVTHSMGFLISRYESAVLLPAGKYYISKNSTGFFSKFDGAFGFADIPVMGELPFFAREGFIVISYMDHDMLDGSLEVKFENPEGKLLNVKGDFKAVKGKLR